MMIVKIQLSLATSYGQCQMLAYNKDRSIMYQAETSEDVFQIMDGRAKAFFNAEMKGTEIDIGCEVEDPGW